MKQIILCISTFALVVQLQSEGKVTRCACRENAQAVWFSRINYIKSMQQAPLLDVPQMYLILVADSLQETSKNISPVSREPIGRDVLRFSFRLVEPDLFQGKAVRGQSYRRVGCEIHCRYRAFRYSG